MNRAQTVDLLSRARDGSKEALDEIFSRYAGRLLAIIRLRMGSDLRQRIESRDILQATLLRSFERFDQFAASDTSSLMGWLARIAQHEIGDQRDFHHRQRRDARREERLSQGVARLQSPVRSALSQIIVSERARRLESALETLPEHYREIILLRRYEELSWPEIASRLGKSEDASRMLLARAMAALTHAMGEVP